MFKPVQIGLALALTFALFTSTALADDWTAVKLRGVVVGLFDGEWVKLQRGAVIPDDQPIRTLASGRVTFERGEESIDLGPNTQIQILDRAGYDKYTTVKQYFGRVGVEAEVRKVRHFAVQTPYLAAVVKGTRFVVISGDRGAQVQVERGAVAVENVSDRSSVVIAAGQEVTALPNAAMQVSGRGKLPQVLGANGKPLVGAERGNVNASNAAGGASVGVGGSKGAGGGGGGSVGTGGGGGASVNVDAGGGGASVGVDAGGGGASISVDAGGVGLGVGL